MSVARAFDERVAVAESLPAEVPGFPPSVALAMLVALVAGLFAYGQTPSSAPLPSPLAAELGPALAGEAAEGWLAAQISGARPACDLAAGTFQAGDSIEALL